MGSLQTIELEGLEEARKLFGDEKFKKASGRAVKKALDKSYTEMTRRITAKWNIKKKDLASVITKRMSYVGDYPTGYLTARSRSLSWRFFGAKQVAKGVSVKVTKSGGRKLHLDSFYTSNLRGTNPDQKAGYGFVSKVSGKYVRKRDVRSDAKNKQTYIRPRLKIKMQRVITVASMFGQVNAFNPTVKVAGDTWLKEFTRQLTL